MAKFTIEYRRTIRTAPYETLAIGLMEEFSKEAVDKNRAFQQVSQQVQFWIDKELGAMEKAEGG